MEKKLALLVVLLLSCGASSADEQINIRVLRAGRTLENYVEILVEVINSKNQRFETTEWSCVYYHKGSPIHEDSFYVGNVPPRGRAVKRWVEIFSREFDSVECRFMESVPSTCP